jgi:hypothetical protein
MTVAFGSRGTWAQSPGTLSVDYPSGVTEGEMLILYVTGRYSSAATPTVTGWDLRTNPGSVANGGTGTNAIDTGTSKIWIFTREATASEPTSVTVTSSGNNFQGVIERYTKAADATWDLAASTGADITLDTSFSVTGNLAVSFDVGDVLCGGAVIASDTPTATSHAFPILGLTFGSGASTFSASTVNSDQRAFLLHGTVVSGATTDNPTYSFTLSDADAGSGGFIRLREVGGGDPTGEPGNVSYVNAFNGNSATSNVVTQAATLSGILNGDFLLAIVQWNNLVTSTVTVTSGWTIVGSGHIDDSGSSTLFAYKFAAGGETSFAATWTTPTTLRCDVEVVQYRGVDAASPASIQTLVEVGTDTVHNGPGITTTENAWILNAFGVRQTGLTGWTPPAGYTERVAHIQGASGTNAIGVYDTNGNLTPGPGLGDDNYATEPAATSVANGVALTMALIPADDITVVPNAGPNQSCGALDVIQLDSSGSTGPVSAWEWEIISGGGSLSSTSVANPTLTAPASITGVTVMVGLKVGAPTIGTSQDTMSVTVAPQTNWGLIAGAWAATRIVTL